MNFSDEPEDYYFNVSEANKKEIRKLNRSLVKSNKKIIELKIIIQGLIKTGRECANDYELKEDENWQYWVDKSVNK